MRKGRCFYIILLSAAVVFFVLGLLFQIIVASGMHDINSGSLTQVSTDTLLRGDRKDPSSMNNNISVEAHQIKEVIVSNAYEKQSAESSYTQLFRDFLELPPIVQAWRQAKIDWHHIIPKHFSSWQRFGANQGNLRLLVSKEEQLTDYLTRYHESGIGKRFGKNHGPLMNYSGCNILGDSCMIHGYEACVSNELCVWDNKRLICVDFGSSSVSSSQQQGARCPNPVTVNPQGRLSRENRPGMCKVWVNQPSVLVDIDSESQAMFYHWMASWSSILGARERVISNVGEESARHIHYLIGNLGDPMLFPFFGTITDYCWRRSNQQVPAGACFCSMSELRASQSRTDPGRTVRSIVSYLDLDHVTPPADRVKVGLISRRKKRFILNEYDLADIVAEMGYECVLLPLEEMTIYEQVREFRSLDVLIGMHGSGLDNVIFLHPRSVLLQILPYKNEHRATFKDSTLNANVVYKEWQVKNRDDVVFHWDLYEQANKEKLKRKGKEAILAEGQKKADGRETLMFWINQDIIIPEAEWKSLIVNCVKSSTARDRGIDITPKV